jgi:hypothetical protein
MKKLSLDDFPDFVRCRDAVQRAEAELLRIKTRCDEIQTTLLSMKTSKRASSGGEWEEFKELVM